MIRARGSARAGFRVFALAAAVIVALGLIGTACAGSPATGSADRGTVAPSDSAGERPGAGDSVDTPSAGDGEGSNDNAGQAEDNAEAVPTPTPEPTETPEPTPTPEGPAPLVVLTVMGESGVMAPIDGPAVAGVVAMAEVINEQGGVLGRDIVVERVDTNSRTSLADRLAERALRTPPDVMIVSCDVEFSKPILERADEAGVITISPCADDTGYRTGSWGARNFTLGAPAEPRGVLAAGIAIERYGSTAMVLRDRTSPEALRFCTGFERGFREAGGSVVYRDEFTYDTLEPLRDRLTERARPSDFIVVCSHVPGDLDAAPSIISMVRNVGFAAPIVAGTTVDEPLWFSSVPDLGDMTYITWSSVFGNDPSAEVNDLVRRASRTVDSPVPGMTTVLGADAVTAWTRAVDVARSSEPARVAAALASFADEELLTGSVSFTGGTRMDSSRTYRVIRVAGAEIAVPELVRVTG